MAARVQGSVRIDADLDARGKVVRARVVGSIPMLDQAALEAVRQWEYAPFKVGGVPTAVTMTVTVQFTLK